MAFIWPNIGFDNIAKRNSATRHTFLGLRLFRLTKREADWLVSQNVIPEKKQLGGSNPYVFTEQGVAMLSSVLRSERAILVNIAIMRAFVKLRELLATNKDLAKRLEELEKKYDTQFRGVFCAEGASAFG